MRHNHLASSGRACLLGTIYTARELYSKLQRLVILGCGCGELEIMLKQYISVCCQDVVNVVNVVKPPCWISLANQDESRSMPAY